jgi:glutamine---fructose-6-phosphate transaminase (isomerizing)
VCGIIGYVGYRPPQDVLLEGLRRLEYRGYDSAGLAWRDNGQVHRVRAVGNLDSLSAAVAARASERAPMMATAIMPASPRQTLVGSPEAQIGIGHTRWATHGGVSERNAHPHSDGTARIWIVLNGIIENYVEVRERLAEQHIHCLSETDAEVVAHLIGLHYDGDLADAVRLSLADITGHYAFVAMCQDEPDTLVGVRRECPLVVGVGDGEQFIASSIAAFLAHTRDVALLRDGEIVVLRPQGVTMFDADGLPASPSTFAVDWDEDAMEKEGFETFMLKEIHEQGGAIAHTLSSWRAGRRARGDDWLTAARLRKLNRIIIVACGTSYHAGLAAKFAIERWARIPVDVDVASEFRYRDPIVDPHTLVLGITQSGETADTLAAMRLARERGATVVAVTNMAGSQATRDADAVLFTRAGIEMGVAATKTFAAQVALLMAFALRLAHVTGTLPSGRLTDLQAELKLLPERMDQVIASVDADARRLAERFAWSPFFLYLGRLSAVPVALEGALKLKEISYIPTDAYAAGEMKHGPIALLSNDTPVVCVATEQSVLPKLVSNLEEVRARGAPVLAVASQGFDVIAGHAEHVFYVPRTDPLLEVVLAVVPLQLFAYHVARARGLNVDQPRNLAKTVTVE